MNKSDSYVNHQTLLKHNEHGEFLMIQLQQEVYWNNINSNRNKIGSFSDVDLCCKDGQTVKVHSAILAVASPYLKNLLTETWSPQYDASISLPDFK